MSLRGARSCDVAISVLRRRLLHPEKYQGLQRRDIVRTLNSLSIRRSQKAPLCFLRMLGGNLHYSFIKKLSGTYLVLLSRKSDSLERESIGSGFESQVGHTKIPLTYRGILFFFRVFRKSAKITGVDFLTLHINKKSL